MADKKQRGAVVNDERTCICGHAPEEHGGDAKYPASTACSADGCACDVYEPDESERE
jgi:hypothetical protein